MEKGSGVPTVLADVSRGGITESVHYGVIAVADTDGNIVASAGDPSHVAFFRSSAKPFQAIPLIESGAADRYGFTPAELALSCASHVGSHEHQTQVAAMLAKIGLDPGSLRCGIVLPADDVEAGRVLSGLVPESPLQCDCSGKHTGMLATCLVNGWDLETYLDLDHPLQQQILGIMSSVMRIPTDSIPLGTDGCSLPTFGGSIGAFAIAYAALSIPSATGPGCGQQYDASLRRLAAAMVAHPENVSGHGALVADLMTLGEGKIVAKSGAEGLLCFALPERGYGVAIRILDGSFRSHAVVAVRALRDLDAVPDNVLNEVLRRHDSRIHNHNKRHVGDHRALFALRAPNNTA